MAASASSSRVPCGKYDVFISFRGPDVRFGFLSHLERELRRKHIDVYVDDRLERGEEISSSLVNAIEGSMIALVIFSKDYASSRWCLEELVKIIECKEAGQQIVIPVFYLVDPSDVRHKKRTFAEAFTLHDEEKFKDKVEIWRSFLEKSANLAGYDSSKFQNESKLIDAIVEDVLKKLEDNSPIMPKSHLIGFHRNFTSVESFMEIELQQEVRILGIWGMGGIGKTTLAHAIFDKFLSKFESRCFLENVREKSTKVDGLKSLHQELISKLLDKKDDIDMNDARRRLKGKKILIVLDDVDNSNQLEVLAGQQFLLLLGSGSRIIVTSRDKQILRSGGILDKYIHEVNALNFEESLELFCRRAFNQSHPDMGYQELSEMTVAIAQGVPLALEVLGSHFHSRDKAYWESELRKLKKNSHEQIQNLLKISYDGLDATEKEIFLDIAFFFIGGRKDDITCGLEACGFEAVSGIQNLIDKALIKLEQYVYIVMHDLIREMAEQIVRGESMRHPERRSRLKDADEIYDVLKSNMGTDEVEGIILDMTQIKYVQLEADIFVKMKNLRFLKIFYSASWLPHGGTHVDLLSNLDSFSNKLRYLHWDHYPSETLPLGPYLENLVELHLERSNVKRLWDGKQDLGNLKKINLSGSKQLIELPDLSMAHKLECLTLNDFTVETLPAYINHLSSLKRIYLRSCKRLNSILGLPPFLQKLDASRCTLLETLPLGSYLENLVKLHMEDSNVKRLWDGKQDLGNLKKINLRGSKQLIELSDLLMAHKLESVNLFDCESLKSLHPSIQSLPNITNLEVSGCSKLESIEIHSESLSYLGASDCCLKKLCLSSKKLSWLVIQRTEVERLHFPIGGCTELRVIGIGYAMVGSVSIDELCCLTNLEEFKVTNLKQVIDIKQLDSLFDAWRNLRQLSLDGSAVETLPASVNHLSSLKRIDLRRCKRLKSILGLPPFLQELNASGCTLLETVSSDSLLRNDCTFMFCNCEKLDERSVRYIHELLRSSMTSAGVGYGSNPMAYYPGSRVPEWMKYKPLPEAFNATEWTCNPEQSQHLLICCIIPKRLGVNCTFNLDELYFPELNRDHVLLWHVIRYSRDATCEFFLRYRDEDGKAFHVRAKECGAVLLYYSEPVIQNTKRPSWYQTRARIV